jgi:hypothetical protein
MSGPKTLSLASPAAQTTTQVPPHLYNVTPLYDDKTLPAKALNEEKASCYKQKLEACALFQLILSDKPPSSILNATNTKETQDRLNLCYHGNSKQTVAFITGELSQHTFTNEKSFKPQLNTLLQQFFILALFGVKLSQSLIAVALLLSLPPFYKTIYSILMKSMDTLTSSAVKDTKLKYKQAKYGASLAVTLNT